MKTKIIILLTVLTILLISGCTGEIHRYECYNRDRPTDVVTIQIQGNSDYEFVDGECRKKVCEVVMVEIDPTNK